MANGPDQLQMPATGEADGAGGEGAERERVPCFLTAAGGPISRGWTQQRHAAACPTVTTPPGRSENYQQGNSCGWLSHLQIVDA